jgi:hypothetical protein
LTRDVARVLVPATSRLLLADIASRRGIKDEDFLADLILRAAVEELAHADKAQDADARRVNRAATE